MKVFLTALTLCLLPLIASANPENYLKNPPIAEDQTLPFGLTLLPGSLLIEDSLSPKTETNYNFAIQTPSASGYADWWGEEYGKQLENLGWKPLGTTSPIRTFFHDKATCRDRMVILSLGPSHKDRTKMLGGAVPEYEYDLLLFNFSRKDCPDTTPLKASDNIH